MDDASLSQVLECKLGPVRCSFEHHSNVVKEFFPHQIDIPFKYDRQSWAEWYGPIKEQIEPLIGPSLCSIDTSDRHYNHDAQWDWLFEIPSDYQKWLFRPLRFRHVNHAITIKMLLG